MLSPIIAVAPMMDRTDRHCRYFLRLIAPHIRLYTEMITAQALVHGDASYLLRFNTEEKYIALQVGGSDLSQLVKSAQMAEEAGYDEVNINIGCPSSRVKCGNFGVALMLKPKLVADCFHAMQAKVKIPVTIKCRIGVDHNDSYENLYNFISLNAKAGCKTFIIHARKAWLAGLSPKENRTLPPLRYEIVHQIKADFPQLNILINGGIKSLPDIEQQCRYVDGVMIGREAYSNPYFLSTIEEKYFGNKKLLTRADVINKFIPYMRDQLNCGVKLNNITRHILGLFQGEVGAKIWRQFLSQHAYRPLAGTEVIEMALALTNEVKKNVGNI